EVLAGKESEGKALVFLRHVYYLRVPFLYGDPAASWAVDPLRFQTAEEWRRLLREQGVAWVVRSPAYPSEIASPLQELEAAGVLAPFAQTAVSDFQGMRISGDWRSLPIIIFEVKR